LIEARLAGLGDVASVGDDELTANVWDIFDAVRREVDQYALTVVLVAVATKN
jgi:hypothetical protein